MSAMQRDFDEHIHVLHAETAILLLNGNSAALAIFLASADSTAVLTALPLLQRIVYYCSAWCTGVILAVAATVMPLDHTSAHSQSSCSLCDS
eukprot:15532-Heterococcus_DN1.PRE.1